VLSDRVARQFWNNLTADISDDKAGTYAKKNLINKINWFADL
jgi:hypothetical protein